MKPLSCALDILQRQEHMLIDYLRPTLAILEKRINYEATKGLTYCGPLASEVFGRDWKEVSDIRILDGIWFFSNEFSGIAGLDTSKESASSLSPVA